MTNRLAECRADMRAIHQATDEIERTMQSVTVIIDDDVWSGPSGDRFRGEWKVQRLAIMSSIERIRNQTEAILEKVKREEGKG